MKNLMYTFLIVALLANSAFANQKEESVSLTAGIEEVQAGAPQDDDNEKSKKQKKTTKKKKSKKSKKKTD